jgi:hypothetical protein
MKIALWIICGLVAFYGAATLLMVVWFLCQGSSLGDAFKTAFLLPVWVLYCLINPNFRM